MEKLDFTKVVEVTASTLGYTFKITQHSKMGDSFKVLYKKDLGSHWVGLGYGDGYADTLPLAKQLCQSFINKVIIDAYGEGA